MKNHLFVKKRPCPATVNDIELTDEIKQYIIANRIYRIPKPVDENKIMNQTINNYNTMNNFINTIEPLKKLQDYLDYNKIDLMPFERSIELKYEKEKRRLEKDQGYHEITQDDLMEILDQVTKVKDNTLDQFNIIYDSDMNKLLLYESGDWRELFLMTGIKTIIRTIQDYYFHAYECYLIRKIRKEDKPPRRQQLRDLLKEYYSFLACMEIDPYIKDKCDNNILYTADDDEYWNGPPSTDVEGHSIVDEFMHFYNNTKDNLTLKKRDNMKNDLIEIVKRNNNRNINDLNRLVISLIKIDPEYKQRVKCLPQ